MYTEYRGMELHTKETVTTVLTGLGLIAALHGGIWFHLFGIPDATVLGYPFHYFWFVAGGPVVLFLGYGVYYRLAGRTDRRKARLRERG